MKKTLQSLSERIAALENSIVSLQSKSKQTIYFKRANTQSGSSVSFSFYCEGNAEAELNISLLSENKSYAVITVSLNGIPLRTLNKALSAETEASVTAELILKESGTVTIALSSMTQQVFTAQTVELTITGYNAKRSNGRVIIETVITDDDQLFLSTADGQAMLANTALTPLKTYPMSDRLHLGTIYDSNGSLLPIIGYLADEKIILDVPDIQSEGSTSPTLQTDLPADDFAIISFKEGNITFLLRVNADKVLFRQLTYDGTTLSTGTEAELTLFSGTQAKTLHPMKSSHGSFLFVECLGGTYCIRLSVSEANDGYTLTRSSLASIPISNIESVYSGSLDIVYHRGRDGVVLKSVIDLSSQPKLTSTKKERYADAYLRYMEQFILISDRGELINLKAPL